uniref:Uncharacterized protein n=1 Tax=Glossina brevipalpis TaxID=37001 RepID=A0A1A9WNR0_9MUSC
MALLDPPLNTSEPNRVLVNAPAAVVVDGNALQAVVVVDCNAPVVVVVDGSTPAALSWAPSVSWLEKSFCLPGFLGGGVANLIILLKLNFSFVSRDNKVTSEQSTLTSFTHFNKHQTEDLLKLRRIFLVLKRKHATDIIKGAK